MIDLERKFHAPNVTAMLNRIASEHLIVGGSGSEPDNAVINLRPRTTAGERPGGWAINGRKIFGTQSIALDMFFSEATWEDAPQGETIISVLHSAARDAGTRFQGRLEHNGDAVDGIAQLGIQGSLRAGGSVVLQRGVSKSGRVTKVFAKAPFAIGAVYIGIAAAARNFAVDFMRDRPRFPLKHPMSHLPSVYNKVGEIDMLIEGARAVMWKAAAEMNRGRTSELVAQGDGGANDRDREFGEGGGPRVASGRRRFLFQAAALERLYRDVRAGLYHPFDSDESLEFLGKSAFGLPMMDPDSN